MEHASTRLIITSAGQYVLRNQERKGEKKMKKILSFLLVSLLILSASSVLANSVRADPAVIRFRLLAVERYFDDTRMFEAVDLITELLNYPNWNNSTSDYESYIHLLSAVGDPTTLPAAIQPFYQGNSTKANLQSEITNFLAQAGEEEIVILYYCGHSSATALSLDYSVSQAELNSWLSSGGLPNAYVNLILDTCHSGYWTNDGAGPCLLGDVDVLSACKHDQSAWCWGCHTAFTDEGLIPGFGSATDTNGDGWISLKEVFDYAEPRCTAYASDRGETQEPVSWYSVCTGNIPLAQRDNAKPFPDFVKPTTAISIGTPKHMVGPNTYVTSATLFTLTAEDLACPTSGIDFTKYKIDAGSWITYTGSFSLSSLLGDGLHTIYYYSEDNAGNEELQKSLAVYLDNTKPTTTLSIGTPQYTVGLDTYVTSATTFALIADDGAGSGVAHTYYKIGGGSWIEGTSFTVTGSDGAYLLSWYSVDNLGNAETANSETVILDNTPPVTTLTIGEPKYISSEIYVTPDTPFTLEAIDTGSGVYEIAYRIYNSTYDSGWQTYTSPFYLTSLADGIYTIAYNSTDNVKNVEATHTISVTLFLWDYIFEDTHGRGTILKINTEHEFFQFLTPDNDYGIRKADCMRQCGRALIIKHDDGELRLMTTAVDTGLDFCVVNAWDLQAGKRHFLNDKAGIE
jgi:hypothetical protein